MKSSDTWLSRFRRLLILAIITILFGVAARLALTRSSEPAAPTATMPASTPTDTATPEPTKTSFIFPTPADTRAPTLTAVPPSRTPTNTPSATPVPPSPTPSPKPSATEIVTSALTISDTMTTLTYTVVISDVYGRRAPYLESSQYQRLKLGQSYTVTAQSSNGIWLQLEVPQSNQLVWVPAAFGLTHGNRDAAPVAGPTLTPARAPISSTAY